MTTANPYAAPGAIDMGSSDVPAYQPTIFSFSGRIGRIRYLAYSAAWNLVMFVFIAGGGAMVAMGGALAVVGIGIVAVAYIALIAAGFAMAVRRLNDLNKSGWLSLLMLVPLANIVIGLYILFGRGTAGANGYGPAPVPNTGGVIAAGLVLPLVFIVGILAAVAIPAYQQYTTMAAEAAQSQQFQ